MESTPDPAPPPAVSSELRTLATICRHVEKLTPAGRRWLVAWLTEQAS